MNSKRRCRFCHDYKRVADGLIINGGFYCDLAHAIDYACTQAPKMAAKKMRAENREAKQRIKTRSEWLKEAQAAVNAYVRARDRKLPCVSCGRFHEGQYHAGHYRSVGSAPELRFNTHNIWRQCSPCNNHLSGNLIPFRVELLNRIGAEMLAWLEGKHEPKRYTIDDLKIIKADYKAKLKAILCDS